MWGVGRGRKFWLEALAATKKVLGHSAHATRPAVCVRWGPHAPRPADRSRGALPRRDKVDEVRTGLRRRFAGPGHGVPFLAVFGAESDGRGWAVD